MMRGMTNRGKPANLLAYLRGKAGMTQQQLADAAGINLRMVQYIECGQRKLGNTTLSTAAALARALGVRIEDLIPQVTQDK